MARGPTSGRAARRRRCDGVTGSVMGRLGDALADAEEDMCEARYLAEPSPVTARAFLRGPPVRLAELVDDREIAARHGLTL
jgi:hypothetical protein